MGEKQGVKRNLFETLFFMRKKRAGTVFAGAAIVDMACCANVALRGAERF